MMAILNFTKVLRNLDLEAPLKKRSLQLAKRKAEGKRGGRALRTEGGSKSPSSPVEKRSIRSELSRIGNDIRAPDYVLAAPCEGGSKAGSSREA